MSVSGELRTKELIKNTLSGLESFLEFTVESGEEFDNGWLPTLDTSLKVGERNQILYRFFEKETSSSRTVQKRSAMEENSKHQVLANDLVRRLCNSMEQLGEEERRRIIDGYSQKLINSGYGIDQTKKIIVNGIRGYEGKGRKLRCVKEGRRLHRTSKESQGARERKKLLAKLNWYRSRDKIDHYEDGRKGNRRNREGTGPKGAKSPVFKSVLFVEQTPDGELARRLREVLQRLTPVMGFSVKVVERNGGTLQSKFQQSSLWDGTHCGREQCVTCNQGAEKLEQCTRRSALYENICGTCNTEAGSKEEVRGATRMFPRSM